MQLNSVRFKINILYTVLLCLILVVYSSVLFGGVRLVLYHDLDEDLRLKAEGIARTLTVYFETLGKGDRSFDLLAARVIRFDTEDLQAATTDVEYLWPLQARELNLSGDFINLVNARGQPVAFSQNVSGSLQALFLKVLPSGRTGKILGDIKDQKHPLRVITIPFSYKDKTKYFIQVGTPLSATQRILDEFLYYIVVSIGVILILTSFMGRLITARILRPVKAVAQIANDITHKNLSIRIENRHTDEELKYMIRSFNMMIARLEDAFRHINEFSSHVAHELRTPLAIIKGEVDLALQQPGGAKDCHRVLAVIQEETNQLIQITQDLLLLARLDYSPDIFKFERLDLNNFLKDIYEHARVLASQKNISVFFAPHSEELSVEVDKTHLRRLFFNLLSNAVKFTPRKGQIAITLKKAGQNAEVSISDTGEGIAEEHLPKIFDKFYRVPKDGKEHKTSSGLGLAIALSIAHAHRGTITVKSKLGQGTTFVVILPAI